MHEEELLYYDTNEAIKFISEQTGIDPNIVAKVLDADVEFMRKIGIIEDWVLTMDSFFYFFSLNDLKNSPYSNNFSNSCMLL